MAKKLEYQLFFLTNLLKANIDPSMTIDWRTSVITTALKRVPNALYISEKILKHADLSVTTLTYDLKYE